MRILLAAATSLLLAACGTQPPASIASGAVSSQVPAAIEAQLRQIGRIVAPPQTAALYAPLQQREPYTGVRVVRDQRFGPDPQRQLLDVFAAEAAAGARRPVLVFVHGGAFTGGARRTGDSPFYDNVLLWAAKNGMVGVNTTYRLAPQHPWPAAQEDLRDAIAWVRQNIAAHGGDPGRIYLMGHSAGAAHVAQYLAHPQFHAVAGGGIAGAIMLSGLYDPATAEANPPLRAYVGNDAARYPALSAVPGMVRSRVPMLLAFAELDPSDFHVQAEQARGALCETRRCPVLLQLQGHSHMSEVYAINTPDTALTDAIRSFVRPPAQ
ncbi:MAG TPA: alpha/beta hydrolase [Ramlibacter sp.]|nr:alpha/beta hydrolase [Ramlibacter sp.]